MDDTTTYMLFDAKKGTREIGSTLTA